MRAGARCHIHEPVHTGAPWGVHQQAHAGIHPRIHESVHKGVHEGVHEKPPRLLDRMPDVPTKQVLRGPLFFRLSFIAVTGYPAGSTQAIPITFSSHCFMADNHSPL